jgi:hypothetical protein
MQPPDQYNRVSTQTTELEGAEIMIAMNRAWMTTRSARALAIVGVVGLTLLASACGGSSGANVAQSGTTTSPKPSAASDDPNAYSACMRNHGVGNFPDPDSNNILKTAGIDKNTPVFKAAARACRSLAPTPPPPAMQAQEQAQELAFAKCMRSHGVPAFPDPQVENGVTHMQVTAGQIDPNSPIVKAAIVACRSKFVGKGAAIEAQKLLQGAAGNYEGRRGK